MRLKLAIKALALVSGVATGANVLASGDKIKPVLDAGSLGFGNMSQQIQDGIADSIGPSAPVIDNILDQGIKLPETESGLEGGPQKEGGAPEKNEGENKP